MSKGTTIYKIPRVEMETLLDIKQDPTEKIRAYVNKFMRQMRKVKYCSDKFTIIALQRGLRNYSPTNSYHLSNAI
jgi:hypothetical protein